MKQSDHILGNLSPSLTPILTFGITLAVRRHATNSRLDISTVFTSLSIMGLMMSPLSNLLNSLPSFVSSLGIFERFESFLEQASFYDAAINQNDLPGVASSQKLRSDIELNHVPGNCIELRNASFSTKLGGDPILHEIDLSIRQRGIYAVSGKIGSGKSLLLNALLGELRKVNGEFDSDVVKIGYCSQSARLFEGTIRDNIVGWRVSDFDETRYNAIIKACGLDTDFAQLTEGDMTVLTNKGDSLSGGQKHRVVRLPACCFYSGQILTEAFLRLLRVHYLPHHPFL